MGVEETLYAEGCDFYRHYSTASLNVRIATLVQGMIVQSGCAYVFAVAPNAQFLILLSVFGILMTFLLRGLHTGYFKAAEEYAKQVIALEGKLRPDGGGPVGGYEKVRGKRYRSRWIRLGTIEATLTLVVLGFVFFLLLGCVQFFRHT